MKKWICCNSLLPSILFTILLCGAGSASWADEPGLNPTASSAAAPADPAEIIPPIPMLGPEYVDTLNGFSIRPPANSRLWNQPVPADQLSNFPLPIHAEPPYWQEIKSPPSKRLVNFIAQNPHQVILVSLLVTRANLNIDEMLESRKGYWRSFNGKAAVQNSRTEIIHDRPVAHLDIDWQGLDPNQPRQLVRESLFQHDKNRYFSILTVEPADDAAGDEQIKTVARMALLSNFHCFNSPDLQKRWTAARQSAQKLLAQAPDALSANKEPAQRWYQILYRDQDAGFRRVQFQPGNGNNKIIGTWQINDFVQNAAAVTAFTKMQGLWLFPPTENSGSYTLAGPIRTAIRLELRQDPFCELFEIDFQDHTQTGIHLIAEGNWLGNALKFEIRPAAEPTPERPSEILEVNQQLYLPLSAQQWLPTWLKPQANMEFIFVRYCNLAMGYYSLRVAGKEQWNSTPATTDNTASPETPPPPKSVWKLIGQTDADGMIVESWVDSNGVLVQQQYDNITLIQRDVEIIRQQWPEEVNPLTPPSQTVKESP